MTAKRWGTSERRVRQLVMAGRVDGVVRTPDGRWLIPRTAPKPPPIPPGRKP